MPVIIQCPSGHHLKVPKKYSGRRIVCPVCEARVVVPMTSMHPHNAPVADSVTSAHSAGLAKRVGQRPSIQQPIRSQQSGADENVFAAESQLDAEAATPTRQVPSQQSHPAKSENVREERGEKIGPFIDFNVGETLPELHHEFELIASTNVEARGDLKTTSNDVAKEQFYNVLVLAGASILLGLLCVSPSLMEQRLARQVGQRQPDTWSYIVMLGAIIQIGISLFAMRVPDWSTVWLLTVLSTSVAAIYACGLAITMFAARDHGLVRQLGLLDETSRFLAQPWCFFVVCIALILAFWCGRFSVGWHQSEVRRTLVRVS